MSRDALLHIPLAFGIAFVVLAVASVLPPVPAAAVTAALVVLFREVTQAQRRFNDDFRTGWDLWRWGWGKTQEWLVPAVAVIAVAAAVQWGKGF